MNSLCQLLISTFTLMLCATTRVGSKPPPPRPICPLHFKPASLLPWCYYHSAKKLSFHSAAAECRNMGGILAEPKNDLENKIVGPSRYYWIGIQEVNGKWGYLSNRMPLIWKPKEHYLFYNPVSNFEFTVITNPNRVRF